MTKRLVTAGSIVIALFVGIAMLRSEQGMTTTVTSGSSQSPDSPPPAMPRPSAEESAFPASLGGGSLPPHSAVIEETYTLGDGSKEVVVWQLDYRSPTDWRLEKADPDDGTVYVREGPFFRNVLENIVDLTKVPVELIEKHNEEYMSASPEERSQMIDALVAAGLAERRDRSVVEEEFDDGVPIAPLLVYVPTTSGSLGEMFASGARAGTTAVGPTARTLRGSAQMACVARSIALMPPCGPVRPVAKYTFETALDGVPIAATVDTGEWSVTSRIRSLALG